MFVTGENMRTSRTHQPLTYNVRLPDEAQADALRLLDASRPRDAQRANLK